MPFDEANEIIPGETEGLEIQVLKLQKGDATYVNTVWKASLRERLSFLFTGKIFMIQRSDRYIPTYLTIKQLKPS